MRDNDRRNSTMIKTGLSIANHVWDSIQTKCFTTTILHRNHNNVSNTSSLRDTLCIFLSIAHCPIMFFTPL